MTKRNGNGGGEERGIAALEAVAAAAGAVEVTAADRVTADGVARRIDEGFALLIGCGQHFSALAGQGLTEAETRRFRALLDALIAAEAALAGDPSSARAAEVRARLYDAVGDAAGRIRARAAYAFRHDREASRLRAFSSAYAPRFAGRRPSMREAVELKLR